MFIEKKFSSEADLEPVILIFPNTYIKSVLRNKFMEFQKGENNNDPLESPWLQILTMKITPPDH